MSRADRQRPKRESAGGGFGNEAVRIRAIAELARVSTPAVRRSRAHQPARNQSTRRDRTECQTARHRYRCLPESRRTIADLAENIRAPAYAAPDVVRPQVCHSPDAIEVNVRPPATGAGW